MYVWSSLQSILLYSSIHAGSNLIAPPPSSRAMVNFTAPPPSLRSRSGVHAADRWFKTSASAAGEGVLSFASFPDIDVVRFGRCLLLCEGAAVPRCLEKAQNLVDEYRT